MIFETHAHYDDEAFDGDRDSLIWAMHEHGIDTIINVGASLRGVRETVTLMERYPFVYGAIGVHPDEVGDLDEEKIAWMRKLCEKEKTVAVKSAWITTGIKRAMKFRRNGLCVRWI